jgi:hypothetical protein
MSGRLDGAVNDKVVMINGRLAVAITNRSSDVVSVSKRSIQLYVNDTLYMNDPLVDGGSVDTFFGSSSSSSLALSSSGAYAQTNPYAAMLNGVQFGERAIGRTTSDAVSSSSSEMIGRLVRGSETVVLHPNTTVKFELHDPAIGFINSITTSVPNEDEPNEGILIESGRRYDSEILTANAIRLHSDNAAKVLEQQRIRLVVGYTVVNQDPRLVFEDFTVKALNPVFKTAW